MGEIVLEVGQLLVILNDLIFFNNEKNQFALSITNFGPLKKILKFKIIYIYIYIYIYAQMQVTIARTPVHPKPSTRVLRLKRRHMQTVMTPCARNRIPLMFLFW